MNRGFIGALSLSVTIALLSGCGSSQPPLGHPVGINPERFRLIAPYETDPRKWERLPWIDQYSTKGARYRISTTVPSPTRQIARVKSYGDVITPFHWQGFE